MKQLTDTNLAEIARNRAKAKASLACEGIHLTAEEQALFAKFDAARLPHDERRRQLLEYCVRKEAEQLDAAE